MAPEETRILQYKLRVPRLPETIRRQRLEQLLSLSGPKTITTITAGPGNGKTTLAVQAGAARDLDTLWYTLDSSDKDIAVFINYLVEGFKRHDPEFGIETCDALKGFRRRSLEGHVLFEIFLSEIEQKITRKTLLVLDEFHLIQDGPDIQLGLAFLLNGLPPNIHTVLISRSAITIPLSRLRAMQRVVDIIEDDLAFSLEETRELFSAVFHVSLEPKVLEKLLSKTGGWISGLILFYNSLKGRPATDPDALLSRLGGSCDMIDAYLDENVYEPLSGSMKDFLTRTSILERLHAPLCARLLEEENALHYLRKLEDRHLFTHSQDAARETFSYHALFRDFLVARLNRDLDPEAIRALHQRAGELLQEQGLEEEALYHFLDARSIEKASAILSRIGRSFIMEGRFPDLDARLKALPATETEDNPWIVYIRAQALQVLGKSDEATEKLQDALTGFRKKGSADGEVVCLTDLGRTTFSMGDFKAAEKDFISLLKRGSLDPALANEIHGYLALIYATWGDLERAEAYLEDALNFLPKEQTARKASEGWLFLAKGFQCLFSGEFQKALEMGREALRAIEPLGRFRLLAMCHQVIGTAYYFMGRYEDGLEQAEKGLETLNDHGLLDSNLAWLLLCASLNAGGMGDTKKAVFHGREALRCFRTQASKWGESYACLALCATLSMSGETDKAVWFAESGLKAVKGLALPLIEGFLGIQLSACLMEKGKTRDVPSLLQAAERILPSYDWLTEALHIQYARFHLMSRHKDKALRHLKIALGAGRNQEGFNWIFQEKNWIQPLLVKAYSLGIEKESICDLFAQLGPEEMGLEKIERDGPADIRKAATAIRKALPGAAPGGLTIRLLGPLKLFIDNAPVPEKQWKSRKARILFEYLAFHRGSNASPKEVLMELLWPEEDPKKTSKRLHVTLAALRKILEPEIPRGVPSSFITRVGDGYTLSLGKGGSVDTELFLDEIKKARSCDTPRSALPHYTRAIALYGGDLLENEPYSDWCDREREILRAQYLSCLSKVLSYLEEAKNWDQCIDHALKYLITDPYDENIYRKLMGYYSRNGNRAGIARAYEKCIQNIEKDLDCPLSPETEDLYSSLMKPRKAS